MGLVPEGRRWRRVVKAVYGMNEAPRKWWLALCAAAKAIGFVTSLIDPCLLLLLEEGVVVVALTIYVDDLICVGLKARVTTVMDNLAGVFAMGQLECMQLDTCYVLVCWE